MSSGTEIVQSQFKEESLKGQCELKWRPERLSCNPVISQLVFFNDVQKMKYNCGGITFKFRDLVKKIKRLKIELNWLEQKSQIY